MRFIILMAVFSVSVARASCPHLEGDYQGTCITQTLVSTPSGVQKQPIPSAVQMRISQVGCTEMLASPADHLTPIGQLTPYQYKEKGTDYAGAYTFQWLGPELHITESGTQRSEGTSPGGEPDVFLYSFYMTSRLWVDGADLRVVSVGQGSAQWLGQPALDSPIERDCTLYPR